MQRIAERHANLVPHRADDVVGGQKGEEHRERGNEGRNLVRLDADNAPQPRLCSRRGGVLRCHGTSAGRYGLD